MTSDAPDQTLWNYAFKAFDYAFTRRLISKQVIAIVDFRLPSSKIRFWLFDILKDDFVLSTWVAHGANSGGQKATNFSNIPGSHQSSLGGFACREPYQGENGYSMRLDGLESKFNGKARSRAIVLHGADYIGNGLVGRSHGCFAVPRKVTTSVIDHLKNGGFLFAFYPSKIYLNESKMIQG